MAPRKRPGSDGSVLVVLVGGESLVEVTCALLRPGPQGCDLVVGQCVGGERLVVAPLCVGKEFAQVVEWELVAAVRWPSCSRSRTGALTDLFGSIALRIVGLVISRDALRARLRQARGHGVPILREAAGMVASYLAAERDLGRIAADADVDTLAPTLIGAMHLLFAGREGARLEAGAVEAVVTTVIAGVVEQPDPRDNTGTTSADVVLILRSPRGRWTVGRI